MNEAIFKMILEHPGDFDYYEAVMKELSVPSTWPQKLFISARLQVDSLKCKISSIT